jgi:hypothetical protein
VWTMWLPGSPPFKLSSQVRYVQLMFESGAFQCGVSIEAESTGKSSSSHVPVECAWRTTSPTSPRMNHIKRGPCTTWQLNRIRCCPASSFRCSSRKSSFSFFILFFLSFPNQENVFSHFRFFSIVIFLKL